MSSLTEPIHIIDGITNKVDKLAIVAFARQMIVKLCRDNPGKWVSVASYDPFSCGTSLFNINSRKKIFNPYGQHELQRNKNGAGKLSQQRILIVDGGFLYTERGQRGQGEQKLVQWLATDTNAPTTSQLNRRRVTVTRRQERKLRQDIESHRLKLLTLRQSVTSTMFCTLWWQMEAASPTRHGTTTTMRVIKERFPHLTELIVRADGAGCYKGKFCRLASMTLGM
jgi:hypothetical protein